LLLVSSLNSVPQPP